MKRPPEIARRLRSVRDSSGLTTKADFARMLGVSWQRWHHYEAGNRVPEIDVLCVLHRKLGISLNWLLCGSGPAKPRK
jgi:transcriptional regulator with XRE-family HTH domain